MTGIDQPPAATPDLVIGMDCSTTGVKCIVWDATGRAVSSGRAALALDQRGPEHGEQWPDWWWQASVAAIARAMVDVDADRIAGIAIAHQRETFVCLDEDGDAVRPAMLWLDLRASREVDELGSERVHRVTGKPPNPTPAYYKLAWMRRNEPELLERTAQLAEVHGYLVQRLTGERTTSIACADPLGLIDLAAGDWDEELLTDAGLRRAQLPRLASPGEVIGAVSAAVAAELGIPAGLPVVAGAGDGQAAALGANIVAPGTAYLNLGTGLVGGCFSADYRPSRAYRAMAGAIPDSFLYEVFIGAGTYMVSWFMDAFVPPAEREQVGGASIEARLGDEAAAVPIGADGLLVVPYLNAALTPYWDQQARGIMVGLSGAHHRGHIYRAMLEGLAYELKLCFDGVNAALGAPVTELVAMGGGARSELWCQIIADVLGVPLVLATEEESTCLGAGMLAAAGTGLHPSVRAAAAAMSSTGRRFEPDAEAGAEYARHFEVYRQVYPAMRPVFPALAAAARPTARAELAVARLAAR